MSRILLFQFSESGWRIAAAELELLEKHLEAGDEVFVITCNGCRFGCDLNLMRNKLHCANCRMQTNRGLKAMSQVVRREDYTQFLEPSDDALIDAYASEHLQTQEGLRGLKYEDFDLGEAVVSILVSRFRNTDVNPADVAEITENLIKGGLATYLSADRILEKYQPDRVYFFNGRGSQQRAILRACEKQQTSFHIVEEGCDLQHYAVYDNATPHDIAYRKEQMLQSWHSGDKEALTKSAVSFYEKRASGYNGYGVMKSFTHQQEQGALPSGWRSELHNVVIYCSSDDEFAAIGEQWKNLLYGSQLEGLKQISNSAKNFDQEVMVYLRMHPNLSHLRNRFRSECEALGHARFEVIAPESPVSSYALMFAADTVVSFASTIGIEATYWGKPSVLLGSCFYQDLDVAYQPTDHEEVVKLLSRKLIPRDKEGALIYASYQMSFGEPYVMSEIGSAPTDTKFRGVHLRGGFIIRQLLALREKFVGPTIDRLIGRQDSR